jgi:sensor domain CHASE-containing protein
MSIRLKTLLLLGFALLVLMATLLMSLGNVLMAGFLRVENEDARRNVMRSTDAISADLDGLENALLTWTQWDDAYKYIEDRNKEFEASNIGSTAFTGMKIDFLVAVTNKGEVVNAKGFDRKKDKEIAVPKQLLNLAKPGSILLSSRDPSTATKGILMLGSDAVLIVSGGITDSAATAPIRGYIWFARNLDGEEIKKLSDTTHLEMVHSRTPYPFSGIRIVPQGEDRLQGQTNLVDIFNKPALGLTVNMSRDFYHQGKKTLGFIFAAIVIIILVFGAVILAVIELLILRRLLKIKTQVSAITESLDFSKMIPIQGKDEIAELTTSINGMICAMSEFLAAAQPPRDDA